MDTSNTEPQPNNQPTSPGNSEAPESSSDKSSENTNASNGDFQATNQPTQPQSPVNNSPQAPLNQPVTSKKTGKRPLLMLGVAILILALIISGVILLIGNLSNRKKSATETKYDIPLIRYAIDNNPLNAFYPGSQSASGAAETQPQVFEGLVSYQNGTQIEPDLASSWSNPNDTTWIFNLKPNVYYHDGDKVTAQDVVYTWKQVEQSSAYNSYLTPTISNVKALNPTTVEIDTSQPDAILLHRMAQMFILDSKAPKGTPQWELGTGAYTVKSGTTPSANNLDLVAFDKWHGGHIYTREIQYTFVADPDQQVKDLKAGKADLIDGISYSNVDASLKQNFNVFTTPQIGTNIILFNTTNQTYSTSNIKIRQAFNLAVNGTEVMNNAQQSGVPLDQLIPQSVPGYNPDIQRTTSISQAAELVKEAGFPNGVTINLEVGEPIVAVAQEIAKEVKPAGINLQINEVYTEQGFVDDLNSGNFESIIEESNSTLIDGSDYLAEEQAQPYYNNPAVDSELTAANQTFDGQQRLKDLQQAELTYYNSYAYVPLYQLSTLNISKKNIVFPLSQYDTDLDVYFANVYSTVPQNNQ